MESGTSLGYLIADVSPFSPPTTLDDLDKAESNSRRSSKWRFQTKPSPALNAGTILPSPLGSKSSSLPRDLPMNRVAVPNVVQLVRASREGPEVSAGQHEKCIQQFALSAVLILWFPLGRVATGRYTVVIASAQ